MINTDETINSSPSLQNYGGTRNVANSESAQLDAMFKDAGVDEETVAQEPQARKDVVEDKDSDNHSALTHMAEVLPSVGTGLITATQELGNFAIDAADWVEDYAAEKGIGSGEFITDESQLDFADDIFKPRTVTGKLVSGVSQFLMPFGAISKASKGVKVVSGLGKFMKAGAMGAAVDMTAFDPKEERLSNLVQSNPSLSNPITSYLASNPKDSKAEGRFKNALEGLGLGTLTEGLVLGLKAVKHTRITKNMTDETIKIAKKVEGQELKEVPGVEAKIDAEGKELAPAVEGKSIENVKADAESIAKAEVKAERVIEEFTPTESLKKEGAEFLNMVDDADTGGKAVNINLQNLKSIDQVKQTISTISEINAKKIDEARRGTITHEATQKLADDLGIKAEDLIDPKTGVADNAETLLAKRQLLNDSALDLTERAGKIKGLGPKATKLDKLEFLNSLNKHKSIQAHVSGKVAEAGRALSAMNIKAGGSPAELARFVKDNIDLHGGEGSIDTMIERISGLSTKQISDVTNRSVGRKTKDAVFETWINGLLSSPKTHIVNALSNTSVIVSSVVERKLAEKSAEAFGAIDSVAQGEAAAMLQGISGSVVDSAKMAWQSFKRGEGQDVLTKLDMAPQKAVSSEAFGVSSDSAMGKTLDVFGEMVRSPGRMLMASDEFFKGVNMRMEIHAQSMREAFREGSEKGLNKSQVEELYRSKVENPSPDMISKGTDFARENTFTKPVGDVDIFGPNGAEALDKFVKKFPAMKVVAPFVRTPMNIMEYTMNRTPIRVLKISQDLKAGGVKRDMAIARVGMGTSIMAVVSSVAAGGAVTGAGPSNIDARKQLEATGWQPYSVKVGDKYVAYNRLDPWGSIIGMAADYGDMVGHLDEDGTNEIVATTAGIIAEGYTPEFLTENLTKFIEAMGGEENKIRNFVGGLGRGAVPFSGALRDIRKLADPAKRQTKEPTEEGAYALFQEFTNNMRNTVPGLSADLPPTRNIWGDVVNYSMGTGISTLNPIATSDAKTDNVSQELMRLGMLRDNDAEAGETDLVLRMPPKFIRKSIGGKSSSVKLNPEQYDKYVRYSSGKGLENSPFPDMTFKEVLSDQIKEGWPMLGGGDVNDEMKKLVIKKIKSAYRKSAEVQLLEEDEEIVDKIENMKTERASALGLE